MHAYTAAMYMTSQFAYTAANHAMAIHNHVLSWFYISGLDPSCQQPRWRKNIETVSGPCNPPSDVFLTAGARAYQKHVLHGPETVSIFIANLRAIFNDILCKISTIFYAKTWDSLYCGRSLDVVRH